MRNSRQVFQLIKSLSKTEKRYFRLQAKTREGDKVYLKLFELIDKAKTYDEDKLIPDLSKKTGETTSMVRKTLTYRKHYLFGQLMRALRNYYQEKLPDLEILIPLMNARILAGKRLHQLAHQELTRSRKKAHRYYRTAWQVPILDLEIEVEMARLRGGTGKWHTGPEIMNGNQILETLKAEWQWKGTLTFVQHELSRLTTDNAGEKGNELLELLEGSLENLPLPHDLNTKIVYYKYKSLIAMFRDRDFRSSSTYDRRIIQIMEANPAIIHAHPEDYLTTLARILTAEQQSRNKQKAAKALEKIERFREKKELMQRLVLPQGKTEMEAYRFRSRMREAIATMNLAPLRPLLPEIETFFLHYSPLLPNSLYLLFLYYLGFIHYLDSAWSKSLNYLNQLIRENKSQIPGTLYMNTRIISLMVHFELGNYELLEYQINNLYREQGVRDRFGAIEKTMLNFLRKSAHFQDQQQYQAALEDLEQQIKLLNQDPAEFQAADYFRFGSWVEAKLTGRPFLEVIREALVAEG